MKRLFPAVLLFGLSACAMPACAPGLEAATTAELLFGRNIGGSLGVSDQDWAHFVTAEIAPRFPAGFTVTDAAGQWRGDDGTIVSEPSKLLMIAHLGEGDMAKVEAIRAAYKARFAQEAVMAVTRQECVGF